MMLAIIGGSPTRFRPYVDMFRDLLAKDGQPMLDVGVHSPGHVAETDAQAREEMWPAFKRMHDRIGGERGWPPITRRQYDGEVEEGSLYVGSPETVARKIGATVDALGLTRFDLKYSAGMLGHEAMVRSIALIGTEVVPRVRGAVE